TSGPPKPKEFEIAYSTAASRATRGTQSNATSGSGVTRFAVGGTTSWTSARMVATASRAPAAAIVWPIMDFVELIRSRPAPNTTRIARASIRSFCGVAVPCAFARAAGFGAEELQRVEAHEADARERVHAASDRGGDHAVGDEIGGERQRRGAGAARRHERLARPLEAEHVAEHVGVRARERRAGRPPRGRPAPSEALP